MPVIVNVGLTEANASSIKPVVSISVVNPVTQVTTQVASADISYIVLLVDSSLDIRGLYPLVQEKQFATDINSITFLKSRVDTITSSDQQRSLTVNKVLLDSKNTVDNKTTSFAKPLSDGVRSQDDINALVPTDDGEVFLLGKHLPNENLLSFDLETLLFQKNLLDLQIANDDRSLSLNKNRTDSASPSDIKLLELQKNLIDDSTSVDDINQNFSKKLSDSTDTYELKIVSFNKELFESFVKSDASNIDFNKMYSDQTVMFDLRINYIEKNSLDVAITTEAQQFTFSKILTDNVLVSDAFANVALFYDEENKFNGKVSTDMVLKYDLNIITSGKNLTDVVSKSDSGSLRMTDYCDVNYFAENYVGSYLSF